MRVCTSSWKAITLSGAIMLVGSAGPLIATASAAPAPLKAAVGASSGALQSGVTAASCTTPTLSQPFLAWQDAGLYTLVSGQNPDQFTGSGWSLYSGAAVQSATVLDGAASSVLDLPAGGFAISPPVCVASDYPTARMIARSSGDGKIQVGAVYAGTVGAGDDANSLKTRMSGNVQGASQWTPSSPLKIHPGPHAGLGGRSVRICQLRLHR